MSDIISVTSEPTEGPPVTITISRRGALYLMRVLGGMPGGTEGPRGFSEDLWGQLKDILGWDSFQTWALNGSADVPKTWEELR